MSDNTHQVKPDYSNMRTLYHWRLAESNGGEVWARGIRINGKPFKTMVFGADLSRWEFETEMGKMKFDSPDESFRRNVEVQYGSLEKYIRDIGLNLPCTGRAQYE